MQAVGLVARSLRRRLVGSLLLIAAVAGLTGGIAAGLVGGAARTSSAADRFVSAARLPDLMIQGPTLTSHHAEQIRRLPGVEGAALLSAVAIVPHGGEFINIVSSVDGHHGVDVDVARIVRGRAADPDAADEMVLGEVVAARLGVDVGDVVRFDSWSPEQLAAWQEREPTEEEMANFLGPTIDLEVVGISRHPADVASDDPLTYFSTLPPGFLRSYGDLVGQWGFRFVTVDLGDAPSPAEESAVAEAALEIVGAEAGLEDAGEQAGGPLMTTLDFVSAGMIALAVAVGVAGSVIVALIVLRSVARAGEDTALLRPMGMTSRGRAGAVLVALAPAAVGAGLLAMAVAITSSAFMPFGLAGRVEPDPGVHLDAPMLLGGGAATTAAVLALVAVAAIGVARRARPSRSGRGPRAMSGLVRLALPAGTICGLHLALGPGRPGARSANRAGVIGVALATMTGAAALVLASSIDHLFATPADYGWTWDLVVSNDAAPSLLDDPAVETVGLVTAAPISFDGRPVLTRGIESLKGELPVLIVDGRHAEVGEVVLGARTMADLDVGIGDTVVAQGSQTRRQLLVVGEAVFAGVIDAPEAGWGAAMPSSAFDELGSEGESFTAGVVSLADGVDADAFTERYAAQWADPPQAVEEPIELERLREIEAFPRILTAFLATVGLVATAHAILVTARLRRSELAVLRSLGLARRGLYEALTVQAGVLVLIGGVVGIPLGVAVGQVLWRSVASSLGVVVTVDVPWPTILGATAAACAVVCALALVPARTAARISPALALRAE